MGKIKFVSMLISVFMTLTVCAQESQEREDAFFIRTIYETALTQGQAYQWLSYLTDEIGGRLAGSPQAAAAVEYTRQMLDTLGLDTVWLQPCMVPRWVRGEAEQVRIAHSAIGSVELNALALGNSVGTGPDGVVAPVVEVKSLDEVDRLGRAVIEGKIVFFNRPMDPTRINTFSAYGGAVDQRGNGAARAGKYGAVAVLVRSMTTRLDDIPHTGALSYGDADRKIPAVAISTKDAEMLSRVLKMGETKVYVRTNCYVLPDVLSYNVIGEVYGSERPEEIILVGGHLDSWDVGTGAHDDGSGCVQSMDVLHLLKRLNYRPKRTLRCVLFMNEENGLRGGRKYWAESDRKNEFHLAAIESDRGGFTPRGFTVDGHEEIFNEKLKKVIEWLPLLEPYGLSFRKGGSGADISGLKSQKGLLFGFEPDTQRYFDYHHTPIDGRDVVNERELTLGTASMTSLVYLLDKYGLD
jgi:carboxypeptidase Q